MIDGLVCEFTKDKKFIESKKGSLVLLTNKELSHAQPTEQTISQNNENLTSQTASDSGFSRVADKHKNVGVKFTVTHFVNGIEIPKEKLSELVINSPVIDRLIALTNRELGEKTKDGNN